MIQFRKSLLLFGISFLSFIFLTQCKQPEVIHDLGDSSFSLVNQDSSNVEFPDDFAGDYVVAAFIYTNCPDICRITTGNMKRINKDLKNNDNVRFVEITFDPKRDTPSVLKDYMKLYKLDEAKFSMLTGRPAEVDSLLDRLNIQAAVSYRDTTKSGEVEYYLNHTDRIMVMDKKGRVRFQYPGSLVPPENVIEDLNKLR